MLLLVEKNGGWWGKKTSQPPSLTLPFAINLNKAGNLAEKEDMH